MRQLATCFQECIQFRCQRAFSTKCIQTNSTVESTPHRSLSEDATTRGLRHDASVGTPQTVVAKPTNAHKDGWPWKNRVIQRPLASRTHAHTRTRSHTPCSSSNLIESVPLDAVCIECRLSTGRQIRHAVLDTPRLKRWACRRRDGRHWSSIHGAHNDSKHEHHGGHRCKITCLASLTRWVRFQHHFQKREKRRKKEENRIF